MILSVSITKVGPPFAIAKLMKRTPIIVVYAAYNYSHGGLLSQLIGFKGPRFDGIRGTWLFDLFGGCYDGVYNNVYILVGGFNTSETY